MVTLPCTSPGRVAVGAWTPRRRAPTAGRARTVVVAKFVVAGGRVAAAPGRRGARLRVATRTRGAAALDASVIDSGDGSNDPAPVSRHLHPPEVFYSEPGEEVLMQFGESMRVEELPEGTRVAYPGVRANAPSDRKTMTAMVEHALDNPIGTAPLREKLRALKAKKDRPKILMAFDDVSIPLPPMRSPDIRAIILEQAERRCIEEGIDPRDIKFVCSIALHRFIREDEFKHVCGPKLFKKYHPSGQMTNYNAVDMEHSVEIGKTGSGERVVVCKDFAEADMMIYANVNYVSMDGGYKSYATGLVHFQTIRYNHDSKTLKKTTSLFDPPRSALHQSIIRIGKVMQRHTDVFHVETVLDDNRFPWYLSWVQVLMRRMGWFKKLLAKISCFFLKFLPNWLRLWIFWGPLVRGQFGLVQVNAGETEAVHETTLQANYEDSVVDVEGQSDILILAPTCIGPYTKDTYLNPLLVNTYALGYYYNMYVGGVPLLRHGGAMIVVNPMPYKWTSPTHDAYKAIFEEAVAPLGPERFEEQQERFANDERLNDIYRRGHGPAAVHGFYMYTWAAHGMEKVGKVFVVGAEDERGPDVLGWERKSSVKEAVAAARDWLDDQDASATFWQCPPVGYARVSVGSEAERRAIAAKSVCPKSPEGKAAAAAAAEAKAKAQKASLDASKARAKATAEALAAKQTRTTEATAANAVVAANAAAASTDAKPSPLQAPDAAKAHAQRATADALTKVPLPKTSPASNSRDMWLGAITQPPAHLDGTLPGDYGFDPLGLGADPSRLAWYREAELMHGRWAMSAVVGIVAADLAHAPAWWNAGSLEYDLPTNALLAIQSLVMGALEYNRARGWVATGQSGVAGAYPFDPLNLRSDSMATKEVKHGRLAMLAFAGIVAQAVVYRVGPLNALLDHVEEPFRSNVITNVARIGNTFEAVASKL